MKSNQALNAWLCRLAHLCLHPFHRAIDAWGPKGMTLIACDCDRVFYSNGPMTRCICCEKPLLKGQLIGEDTKGRFIHAGFQGDGSFCETGGIASGWWDGEKKVPIDWSQYNA